MVFHGLVFAALAALAAAAGAGIGVARVAFRDARAARRARDDR